MTTPQKKVPALRFPEFNREWEIKKISNLFFINAGGDIEKKHVSEVKTGKSPYPIYANAEKRNGLYGYSDLYKVDKDCVTVAGRGVGIGRAVARDHKFYPIVRLLVLVPKKESDIYFFEHAINRMKIFLESTGVPQLTAPQISSYKLQIPAFPEQEKIAAFLTAVNTRIDHLERKKTLLEQYKKGIVQQIFSQELRFKDDKGKNFPAWKEKKFESVFSFFQTNSFSRSLLNYDEGTVKNIHYGDIHTKYKSNFDITKEEVPFINKDVDLKRIPSECYCKEGDLVVADASEDYKDVGKAIELINLDGQKLLSGLHTFIARNTKGEISLGFMGYLMQSRSVRLQIMRVATGISVLGISKGNLAKVKIQLPCIEEQQKIAAFLTAIDDKINLVANQIEKTKAYKKGLLQQMFV